MPSTDLISSSFNSSLISSISSNNSSTAVISVLKDMMEGLGWHDMTADIYQAEAEHELANQKLATAVKYYLETNDTHSRAQLMKALSEKLKEIQSEYDHAIKQQKYYEAQAKIEAEQKSTAPSSYLNLSQWSHWIFDGIKTFFGSTTEQQIEKYKTIASNRSLKIEKLSDTLNSLQVDDTESDHYVKIHNSENVSLAHFPEIINLGSLNGVQGFRMYGENKGDNCDKVNKGGDINSDGYDDLIIGAAGYPQSSHTGRSYVVFGEPEVGGSGVLNLSSLNGVNGFKLDGEDNWDQSSFSVSAAGDINGDEHDDLIIGAWSYSTYGSSVQRGRSYVVFGKAGIGSSGILNLSSLNGTNGFKLDGENNQDFSGYSVSSAGDVNSDGYDDLIIGAYGYPAGSLKGRSYVVFGPGVSSSGIFNLSNLTGVNGFKLDGENNQDYSGCSVSSAGDVNSDGYDDLIIGAYGYPGGSRKGRSYVVFGPGVSSSGIFNLSNLTGPNGFKLDGESEGDLSGLSVSGAGDINGDGYYDLIIGAPSYPAAYHRPPYGKGRSYVVFGSKELGSSEVLNLSNLTGLNGFKLDGEKDGDESGYSVSTAGDINGDGYDDLIIGATRNYYSRGRSYVVFGSQQVGNTGILNLSSLDGMTGFKLDGEENGDFSGAVVSSAGDINGDGVTDLTIGAFGPSFQGRSYVVFGDIPPVLLNNSLNLNRGEKLLLTSIDLAAIDRNHDNSSLVFIPIITTHGYFENINQPGIVLANFTQQEITSLKIRFIHDGSLNSPTYNITVRSSGIAWTGPSAAIVNFNPMPIVLVNNQLSINQSQSLQLTTSNLLASCNISNSNLTFIINNITHGSFLIKGHLSLSPTVSIPQQAIEAEEVTFIQDGSQFAPGYQVSVTDPWIETIPMPAQIGFNSAPFFLVNNQLSIKQNQTLILDSKNLMATRNDIAVASFTFVVTNIAHGIFNINGQTSASQISFAQQAILSAQVSFTQDGSRSAPSYIVAVSDGWNQTTPTLANISFLLKPLLSINQFLVSLNQSTLLSLNNICANDCYEDSADNLQFKIVDTVENGQFESMQNVGKPISQFTQKNIKQGDIRFVSNGVSKAPRYQLSVTDPVSKLSDTLQASTLLVTRNYLRIDQGSQFELSAEYLAVTSSNGKDDDIIFTPVEGSVQHGFFSLTSNPASPVATFKQGQINNKQVLFVPDDSGSEPKCILSVRDSQPQGAIGSFACQIDFASYPRLDHAFLKIAPPDRIPLTVGNLEASDDRVTADKLYFLVSEVKNDHFAYGSNFEIPISNFTQFEINNGRVYFIAKTTEPPEFKVSVWNGRLFCRDCPKPADIVAPSTGGNSDNSLWIGLLSGLGTVVLLPLMKAKLESGLRSYFSSRENTLDSQIANAALARLWLGCCGIITRSQYEAYARAFGQVVDELSDAKQLGQVPLREKWPHLSDRVQGEIKSRIAEESERILVGSQSSVCRFFKSLCRAEATPADIESKAVAIARAVRPSMPGLFAKSAQDLRLRVTREEDEEDKSGSLRTPLLEQPHSSNGGKEPINLSPFN